MPNLDLAARAGRWSARHRRTAILGWLAFVVTATILGSLVGTRMLGDNDAGNGESKVADKALAHAGFPDDTGEQVLLQPRHGTRADSPEMRAAASELQRRLARVRGIKGIASPFAAGHAEQLSKDGRSALVTFTIGGGEQRSDPVAASLAATAAVQRAHPGLRVEQVGDASVNRALDKASDRDLQRAERLSIPITLAILLFAFGALVAAGLPLALGLTAVVGTLGLLGPVSRLAPLTDDVNSLVLLIGLAVGVDYSLFYVRRVMEERDAGRDAEAAVTAAAASSGRAVLISGLTVMIAMAGMLLAGHAVFVAFAVGTMLVVAVAVAGSLTFLPAMLTWLGRNGWIERGRVPYLARLRHRTHDRSRAWSWILTRVLRRPALFATAATVVLVALALPGFGMHTIDASDTLPNDLPIARAYARVQAAFPGGPDPAVVVVQARDVSAPPVRSAIAELRRRALASGQMSGPIDVAVNPRRTVAAIAVPLHGNGTDAASKRALGTLRHELVPATVGAVRGVRANVTGRTAGSEDFNASMRTHLPFVFAFVLGLAFVLLLVSFRSLVVPLHAVVLNLLSVGASYGVLELVFQDGRLEGLLHYQSLGGIAAWLPLFLFVILFGLSMDYHVFILSRIREAVDRGRPTSAAIAEGIESSAGVVTSAAVVMVAVFSLFGMFSSLEIKQMGVGLAVAILIDATLVRAVLLPSTMKLLGRRNWYLPKRLQWLPRRRQAAPEPSRP